MSRLSDDRIYEVRSLEVGAELPRYHDWLMEGFAPFMRGRVVEIGAGLGTVAQRYVDAVDSALLIEPAVNLHAQLAERFAGHAKVETACATLAEVITQRGLAPASFDCAIMVNVLEHIDDDVSVVRDLARLLKPGGNLLIFVPALPVLFNALDERVGHVRRYTKSSLQRVLDAASLSTVAVKYFDLLGTIPWWLTGSLLKRSQVSPDGAKVYDRFVVPLCRAVDHVVRPPLGKNLLSISVKR